MQRDEVHLSLVIRSRLQGNWAWQVGGNLKPKNIINQSINQTVMSAAALMFWYLKTNLMLVHQRWRHMHCLRPSSARFRAWRSCLACGSRGRAGSVRTRYPSWSIGPSRPGHRYHNGRHMPAARTLTDNTNPLFHASGLYHHVLQLGKTLPFLSPKSFGSNFTTPSVKVVSVFSLYLVY